MVDDSRIDRIEAWLKGKMSDAEADAFRLEMEADPALYEDVEMHRLALLAGEYLSQQQLKKNVRLWLDENKVKPTALSLSRRLILAFIVLLITTIMLLCIQLFNKTKAAKEKENLQAAQRDSIAALQIDIQNKQSKISDLAAQDSLKDVEISLLRYELNHLKKIIRDGKNRSGQLDRKIALAFAFTSESLTRGGFSETDTVTIAATNAFNLKDYARAETLLKSIPPNDARQGIVIQLLPYTLFYNEKFEEALIAFSVLRQQDRFEAQKAEWYILLCHVAEGQKFSAQKLLDDILKKPEHQYYNNAENLKFVLKSQ